MESEKFDFAALIDEVAVQYGPDGHDIAAKAVPRIPESARTDVLLYLTALYVRVYRPSLAKVLAGAPGRPVRSGHLNKSAKVQALQRHARLLAAEIRTEGGVKYLGECNYEDLLFAATVRRSKAAENLRAAEQHEDLARLLKKHKKTLVKQLPSDALDGFVARWNGRAAA